MKKINNLLFVVLLALGIGLTACKKGVSNENPTSQSEGNTHISVSLSLASNLRSLPDEYNKKGEWGGQDEIKSITVFVSDYSEIIWKKFEVGQDKAYKVENNAVKPNAGKKEAAIRTTPGIKEVFVVVNSTPELDAHLGVTTNGAGATAGAAGNSANEGKITDVKSFREKYVAKLDLKGKVTKGQGQSPSYTVETSASKLAKTEGNNGDKKDVIAMTNLAAQTINVAPNVSEETAIAGTSNQVKLSVDRAVARVIVTKSKEEYDVPSGNGAEVLGKITDIKWVLAQGENSLYVQRKADYKTPGYDFVPNGTGGNFKTEAAKYYDYSGLFENYNSTTKTGGTDVPTNTGLSTAEQIGQESVKSGKFILPNTHEAGDNAENSKYKKGNTAYVMIRAKFKPSKFADDAANGTTPTPAPTTTTGNADDGTFYVGANGKFYHSAENATKKEKGGVEGQTVAEYKGGKVLYYAWINPNDPANPVSSPVIRNNIYHIHITGFKTLGTNWNPLFPDFPNTTEPKLENPDPQPTPTNGVTEPENPIRPEDPLKTPETYMSVEVTVRQWMVHGYELNLGI